MPADDDATGSPLRTADPASEGQRVGDPAAERETERAEAVPLEDRAVVEGDLATLAL